MLPELQIAAELAPTLERGHPWVYRDQILSPAPGEAGWVRVRCGAFQGSGFFDPGSPLALRIYSRLRAPDSAWFAQRVKLAWELRAPIRGRGDTSAYRVLAGEGDGLPGVVADLYAQYLVVSLDSAALSVLLPPIVDALRTQLEPKGIVLKLRGKPLRNLAGRAPPDHLIVGENGLRFGVALAAGQKTGLFLDQRDNRQTIRNYSAQCRVLNLFAYTGAFSVYAASAGARQVTSVEIAAAASSAARDNFSLNGLDPTAHEFVTGDAFEYLDGFARSDSRAVFDLVISDPPSFARGRAGRQRAVRAYERLHRAALAVVRPGGFYAAASCTTQVGVDAFRGTLATAARQAGCRLQLVHDAGQPLDHPIFAGHPEGRYLKFMICRVTPQL